MTTLTGNGIIKMSLSHIEILPTSSSWMMTMMMKISERWDTVECVYIMLSSSSRRFTFCQRQKTLCYLAPFQHAELMMSHFFCSLLCVHAEYKRLRTTFAAEWQEGKNMEQQIFSFFCNIFTSSPAPLSHHLITLKFSLESSQMLAHRTINQRDDFFFSREILIAI